MRSRREPAVGAELRSLLGAMSDDELLMRFRQYPPDSPQRAVACEILVARHEKLVRNCVRQYRNSPEPVEDLTQVGYAGLLKAINNYDPAVGHGLAAYAVPCVSGENKRHFRDKRWQVHVRRAGPGEPGAAPQGDREAPAAGQSAATPSA